MSTTIQAETEMIQKELSALQTKVMVIKTRNTELEAKLNATPEYVEAEQTLHKSREQTRELHSKLSKAQKALSVKVLTNADSFRFASPYYTKTYSGQVDTNIRPEVIEAIKANLKINKLKGSQVEQIARKLLDHLVSLNPESALIQEQLDVATKAEAAANQAYRHQMEMFSITVGRHISTYDDEKEIKRLEDVLANPAKLSKEIERLSIPSKLPAIFQSFQSTAATQEAA